MSTHEQGHCSFQSNTYNSKSEQRQRLSSHSKSKVMPTNFNGNKESMMTMMITNLFTLLVVLSADVVAADAVGASSAERRSNGYISNVDAARSGRAFLDTIIEELHPVTTPTRRMLITKYEDVASTIRSSMENTHRAARHFDIEAHDEDDTSSGYNTLLLHVDTMTPAVTSATTFSFRTGRTFDKTSVDGLAILASPRSNTIGGSSGFTILSVNTTSGNVRGIQRDQNGDTSIRQISSASPQVGYLSQDHSTLTSKTTNREVRAFACGVDHNHGNEHDEHEHDHSEHEHHHHHHHHHHRERRRKLSSIFDETATEEAEDYHDQQSFKLFDPNENQKILHNHDEERTFGTGAKADSGTTTIDNEENDGTTNHPGFVINLAIAIDAEFIRRQGGSTEAAVEYIDWLISAANVIFTKELDVHLNVVSVEEIDIFDNVNTLRDGLKTMRLHYEQQVRPNGGVNLVHALLGKDIGGGIAFIDTVCDDMWGVGLSSGLRGVMDNLDEEAMHDAHMVAHEIGHSLGSDHTFDGYSPPVDTCGVTCPAGLPDKNAASLMSYCNFCEGGLSNIALTLGGNWNGVDSRLDLNAWDTSPDLKESSVSLDPARVNHQIWTALNRKGECIRRPSPTESGNLFLVDVASPSATPTASPTTSSSPTKSPTHFPDPPEDGRHWVRPDTHCMEETNCASAVGIMFDLQLETMPSTYDGVLVESVLFEHLHRNQNQTVDVYTTQGSYVGKERDASQWSKIAIVTISGGPQSHTQLVLDSPIEVSPGNVQGFYLVAMEGNNFFLTGRKSNATQVQSDDANGASVQGGSVVFGVFNFDMSGFTPSTQIGYTMLTTQPSSSPTYDQLLIDEAPSFINLTSVADFKLNSTDLPPTPLPSHHPTISSFPSISPTINLGPFSIQPDHLCDSDCFVAPGFMFSVKNKGRSSRGNVVITGVSFEHIAPKQSRIVELYRTVSGSYTGREQNPAQWIKVASIKAPRLKFHYEEFVLDNPIILPKGETAGFYIKAEEKILVVSKNKRQNGTPSQDGNVNLSTGSAVMNGRFGNPYIGYSWNGLITYSTTTLEPTSEPTMPPDYW